MKKDGGIIENWQTHCISDKPKELEYVKSIDPDFEMDKAMVFTGTIVEDPTGRWEVGYHMRSSLIIKFDKETGVVETRNTIYKLLGEEGGDTFPDLGPGVVGIFYD